MRAAARSAGTWIAGIDLGSQDRDEVEAALRAAVELVAAPVLMACTHLVSTPDRHWAFTLELAAEVSARDLLVGLPSAAGVAVHSPSGSTGAGAPARRAGAQESVVQRVAGSGRVVLFQGQDSLPDTLPVDELCRRTAIDEVEGVAAEPVAGKTLHTRGFVRPELREGRMVLLVRPYLDDDGVAPFEVPHPTPCCAAHG